MSPDLAHSETHKHLENKPVLAKKNNSTKRNPIKITRPYFLHEKCSQESAYVCGQLLYTHIPVHNRSYNPLS